MEAVERTHPIARAWAWAEVGHCRRGGLASEPKSSSSLVSAFLLATGVRPDLAWSLSVVSVLCLSRSGLSQHLLETPPLLTSLPLVVSDWPCLSCCRFQPRHVMGAVQNPVTNRHGWRSRFPAVM